MKPKPAESQALPIVVIVGGGASGTLAAVRLLESERAKANRIRVVLIERSATLGRGIAYGTEAPFHLLNVRQNRMSAYPEDADHFSRWLARFYPSDMKNPFQPRHRYARYLENLLADARRSAPGTVFTVIHGEAKSFSSRADRIEVELAGGKTVVGDRLVLATGHARPRVPAGLLGVSESARFHADPWDRRIDQIGKNETILVVGSGLTAVDFVLTRMRAGHLASIDLVSRHGLAPLSHPPAADDSPLDFTISDESVREAVRDLRSAARRAGERWPGVVDRFRAEVPRVWAGWTGSERGRFLRHARAYWETHRHRVAPEVHREWDLYRRGGKVKIEAGRISGATEAGDGIAVRVDTRAGGGTVKRYDRVVNCTGASPDLALLSGHSYEIDPLALGIPTDAAGRPLREGDAADPAVFVLGPALRTRFWEMTAVPDLRAQAKVAVDALLGGLE